MVRLLTAIFLVLISSCNVADENAAGDAASCAEASECAGKGLTKGPCDGQWTCPEGTCAWACSGAMVRGMCEAPADCEGQGLERPDCDGTWTCIENQCDFSCGQETMECASNADCPAGYTCVMEGGAEGGYCAATGGCECPTSWSPVCGADANTYPNPECAACANSPVAFEGECVYCQVPPSAGDCAGGVVIGLGIDDGGCPLGGKCLDCGCTVGDAVCASDGNTYPGGCYATCAGSSVASTGPCAASCASASDCGEYLECAVPSNCPGNAVCPARCVPVPACLADADCGVPVTDCGCGAACVVGTCTSFCYRCGVELGCADDADCEGMDLPHADCAGRWSCTNGACEWNCSTDPGTCSSEYDPATGLTCTTCVNQQGEVTKTCG